MSLPIAALLPAAGLSRRMGQPKTLLPFADRTAIELLVATLLDAGLGQIVVILGPGGESVAEVLDGWPVVLAWNRAVDSDMAASLRKGLQHLDAGNNGVLVALVDHPLVTSSTVAALCDRHRQFPDSILIPTCRNRRGHPVLLPRPVLQELILLPTLRDVIHRHPSRTLDVPVSDPGILLDLDTPEDYRRALEFHSRRQMGAYQPPPPKKGG